MLWLRAVAYAFYTRSKDVSTVHFDYGSFAEIG